MNFKSIVAIFFILLTMLILSACGSMEGDYVQLPKPFGTEDSTPDTLVSVPDDTSSESATTKVNIECKDDELVRVTDYITDAKVDIKYATSDNFTGGKIYDFDDAYLRYGTVMKLKKAADALREQGYRILIWDSYRPQEAQFTLFENSPDPTYVSDPNKGFSSHSSGGTVDITLIKLDGSAVEMPTGFDNFSDNADRNYDDVSKESADNSKLLEKAMEDAGFKGYSEEWWHYSDKDTYQYDDIKDVSLPSRSKKTYKADCDEFIKLRKSPEVDSDALTQIPAEAEMIPYCWIGKYVGVKYGECVGYVSKDYVK